jgi:hypothetical protein
MDNLSEETANNESARICLIDASRHQVEEMLIVEASRRRCVTRSNDLSCLDLKIGDRVSASSIGKEQVSIHLVGIGSFGILSNVDISEPDRPRL